MPFSTLPDKDFFDRQQDMALLSERILSVKSGLVRSAVLSGPRGIGKTELLKQLFGRLFWKQDRVVPFHYTVNPAHLSAAAFAKTYLVQFLCQKFAFEKKEQALLHQDGMSIEDVSALAKDRAAHWAVELLARYRRNMQDPLDALHIAITAPYRSVLATGIPVAVLIDEFQRLRDLHIEGLPDPKLVALLEEPLSSGRTPHLITGNVPEIQEMDVASGLERIPVRPLGPDGALSRARALLGGQEVECSLPPLLMRLLGGNPLYIGCVVGSVSANAACDEAAYWEAYLHEVSQGTLSSSWSAVLKRFFPDLDLRRSALMIAHTVHRAPEPLSCQRIARSLELTDRQVGDAVRALYLSGIIRGEFGVLRPVEDRVLRDVLEFLYQKEVLGQSGREQERAIRERLLPQKEQTLRFDLAIPMVKESELIAAQCIEQIGKNLHIHEDIIGQLQIAVIEACINAIEHGKGMDDAVAVSIAAKEGRLEVSIESAGPEFIMQETGEPARGQESAKEPARGWGIKLMKRFADEVRFERTAKGTRTVLIKNLGISAGVQKEGTGNRG
jgi:anti-sigma regulatory factor (Ser/Thr protein kinase)